MFQFRRFPAYAYLIQRTLTEYCSAGFPHSEIHGSMDICSSPWLIAACHVLRRLLMPRHSPCALYSLTSSRQSPFRSAFVASLRLPTKAALHSLASPLPRKTASLGLARRRLLGSLLRIMQAPSRDFFGLIVSYPTSFQMCSTIKTITLDRFQSKTSLLPYIVTSFSLFSFQGAVSNSKS